MEKEYLEWVKQIAKDFVTEDSGISMGDVDAVATAYALTHGMDENTVIDDLWRSIDDLLVPPNRDIEGLWSNEDLQKALDYVKENIRFHQRIIGYVSDRLSVEDVINRGCADDFDRYDSDIAEQFISAYLKVAERKW